MYLLGSTKISVKLQVMIRVDNVGAIFMASTITITSYNKHIDIRCMYVNEYVEDRIEKIFFLSLLKMTATFAKKP